MKFIIILSLILMAPAAFAKKKAPVKKTPTIQDKTYQVEKNAPEIAIGESDEAKAAALEVKALSDYWHFKIIFTDLTFRLPALTGGSPDFSQNLVGFNVSRKHDNKLFGKKGTLEFGGQWQQYERTTKVGPRGEFSQEINVYQLNVFQNFNFIRAFDDTLFVTAGLGLAPIYLTAAQSIYNNSLSELGYQVMGKANFIFPITRIFSWTPTRLAANVELLAGTGKVAEHSMSTFSVGLGVDFE